MSTKEQTDFCLMVKETQGDQGDRIRPRRPNKERPGYCAAVSCLCIQLADVQGDPRRTKETEERRPNKTKETQPKRPKKKALLLRCYELLVQSAGCHCRLPLDARTLPHTTHCRLLPPLWLPQVLNQGHSHQCTCLSYVRAGALT